MGQQLNGVSCLMYKGEKATKALIEGQGDADITFNGDGIEVNNKASGGYRVMMDSSDGNNTSTKSADIAVTFTFDDEAASLQFYKDAHDRVIDDYYFEFGDKMELFGKFQPSLTGKTAAKDNPLTLAVTFRSSGQYTYQEITP